MIYDYFMNSAASNIDKKSVQNLIDNLKVVKFIQFCNF